MKGMLRHGRRKVGNLYLQEGDEPSDADPQVAWIPHDGTARAVVRIYNSALVKHRSGTDLVGIEKDIYGLITLARHDASEYWWPATLIQAGLSWGSEGSRG